MGRGTSASPLEARRINHRDEDVTRGRALSGWGAAVLDVLNRSKPKEPERQAQFGPFCLGNIAAPGERLSLARSSAAWVSVANFKSALVCNDQRRMERTGVGDAPRGKAMSRAFSAHSVFGTMNRGRCPGTLGVAQGWYE
jgi:hypothetical protein